MSHPVATYEFDRGETISLVLEAVAGDPGAVTAATAKLKALPWGANDPDPADPGIAFAVAYTAPAGNVPGFWTFTIAAGVSAGLDPGLSYRADARLAIGGGVVISDAVAIVIRQSISG